MSTGVLIDSNGHDAETLTAPEHEMLKSFLDLMRADPRPPLAATVDFLLHVHSSDGSASDVLNMHIWNFLQEDDDGHAILWSPHKSDEAEPVKAVVTEEEFKVLADTLAVLRIGGWFADFLSHQAGKIANATTPGDRSPSPLQVMGRMTLEIEQFENDMEHAHDMVKLRPDLFQHDIAPPAVPETKQDTSAAPPKKRARRKRAA